MGAGAIHPCVLRDFECNGDLPLQSGISWSFADVDVRALDAKVCFDRQPGPRHQHERIGDMTARRNGIAEQPLGTRPEPTCGCGRDGFVWTPVVEKFESIDRSVGGQKCLDRLEPQRMGRARPAGPDDHQQESRPFGYRCIDSAQLGCTASRFGVPGSQKVKRCVGWSAALSKVPVEVMGLVRVDGLERRFAEQVVGEPDRSVGIELREPGEPAMCPHQVGWCRASVERKERQGAATCIGQAVDSGSYCFSQRRRAPGSAARHELVQEERVAVRCHDQLLGLIIVEAGVQPSDERTGGSAGERRDKESSGPLIERVRPASGHQDRHETRETAQHLERCIVGPVQVLHEEHLIVKSGRNLHDDRIRSAHEGAPKRLFERSMAPVHYRGEALSRRDVGPRQDVSGERRLSDTSSTREHHGATLGER